jgi:hypothetical protein
LAWRWRVLKKNVDNAWKEFELKVLVDFEQWLQRRTAIDEIEISRIANLVKYYKKQKDSQKRHQKLKELNNEIDYRKRVITNESL